MKVAFLDFWPKFNPYNNFLIHSLRQMYHNVEIVHPMNADYLFFSVFGNENLGYNHCRRIAYTGENVDAKRFEEYADYSLSFCHDTERNRRLPLWYWYIDWFEEETYQDPAFLIPVDWLNPDKNPYFQRKRHKFCSAVFSNPVESRFEAMRQLSTISPVDGYGRCHDIQIAAGEQNKLNVISNYRFHICFENSLGEGYVTEKLLHARIAGCMPIYWGSEDAMHDFHGRFLMHENWEATLDMMDAMYHMDLEYYLHSPILKDNTIEPALNAIKYVTQ